MNEDLKLVIPAINELQRRMKTVEDNAIAGLRDFFATSALSVLASGGVDCATPEEVAKFCYEVADAMLIEREKK